MAESEEELGRGNTPSPAGEQDERVQKESGAGSTEERGTESSLLIEDDDRENPDADAAEATVRLSFVGWQHTLECLVQRE